MVITIDGPVASGKSTAAKNLAAALAFRHFDTGAIYRAVTLLALEARVDASDGARVRELLEGADIAADSSRVRLSGRDVSDEIRTPAVTAAVRPFAENIDVRRFVNAFAQRFTDGRNVVVEGRDMGTVVFPDASLKIYLTASDEERARRRWEELKLRGTPQEFDDVLAALRNRDEADRTREVAPLKVPEGAVVVDSTGWSEAETKAKLFEIAGERLKGL